MDSAASHNTVRVVQAARRRMLVAAILEASGRCMAWGATIGLAGVLAIKVFAFPIPWWMAVGVPLAGAAVVGAGIAYARRGTLLAAAGTVDRRLGLKDRLSTATALQTRNGREDAFVNLAMSEAETASSSVNLRDAVPIRLGRSWSIWPTVLASSIVAAVFVPQLDILARPTSVARATRAASERVQAQLSDIREQAQQPVESPTQPVDPKSAAESARVLEEVRKELAAGTSSPQVAAERAARELDKIAQQREQAATAAEMQRDSVKEAMRGLPKQSPTETAGETDLTRALRAGDFAEASRAAREMLNSEGSEAGAADQRARAAKELEQLARDLRAAARATEDAKQAAEPAAADTHEAPGTDQAPPTDSGQADNSDSEQASNARPEQSTEDLAKSLERAAEAMRHEPKPSESASPPTGEHREPDAAPADPARKPEQAKSSDRQQTDQPKANERSREQAKPSAQDQPQPAAGDKSQGSPRSSSENQASREGEPNARPDTESGTPQPSSEGAAKSKPDHQPDAKSAEPDPSEKSASPSSQSEKKPDASSEADRSASDATKPEQSRASGDQTKPSDGNEPKPDSTTGKPRPSDSAAPKDAGEPNASPRSDSQTAPVGENPKSPETDPRATPKNARPSPSTSGETDPSQPNGSEKHATPGDQPDARADSTHSKDTKSTDAQGKPVPKPSGSPQSSSVPDKLGSGPLPEPSRDDIKKLADKLQQLANTPKDAAANRQQSQALRKKADELLRSATPEQREQLERWAGEVAKEMRNRGGAPSPEPAAKGTGGVGNGAGDPAARAPSQPPQRTETVDARTPTPKADDPSRRRERVIAEWYSDRPVDRNALASSGAISSEGQELAKEAAREGERALETQIVPSRFDRLLQRYFQRLPQRAGAPAAPAAEKPAEPAKDAPGAAAP